MTRFTEPKLAHDAMLFVTANQAEIERVSELLRQGAVSLIQTLKGSDSDALAAADLPVNASMLDSIEQRLVHKELDPGMALSLLRSMASCFVRIGLSGRFWSWIDGAGFLADCCGTHWKYMTPEQRSTRLQWAAADAQQVLPMGVSTVCVEPALC